MDLDLWRARFPELYRETHVDYADCRVRYTTEAAPDDGISRLHLVAVTEEKKILVCRSVEGHRFLPGGTREPDETVTDLAGRELLEEAGAELAGEYLQVHDPIQADILRHAHAMGLCAL